jgi:hypothetical protein
MHFIVLHDYAPRPSFFLNSFAFNLHIKFVKPCPKQISLDSLVTQLSPIHYLGSALGTRIW